MKVIVHPMRCAVYAVATIFFLLLLAVVPPADAQQTFPRPVGAINDFAGVIPADQKAQMEALAREVLEKTGTAIVVAVVSTIGDAEVNEYANELYSSWAIGKKGEDKGVLLFVTVEERKMRIETGYGVEGILPDGLVGEIRDKDMVPHFAKNNYGTGLLNGMTSIASVIRKNAGSERKKGPAASLNQNGSVSNFASLLTTHEDSSTRRALNRIRKKNGVDVVLVTIRTLGGIDIDAYADDLYKTWGIGRECNGKGVLILAAIEEQRVRILARGMEKILPGEFLREIEDRVMMPDLEDHFPGAGGLINGISVIAAAIAKNTGGELVQLPARPFFKVRDGLCDLALVVPPVQKKQIEEQVRKVREKTGVNIIIVIIPAAEFMVSMSEYANGIRWEDGADKVVFILMKVKGQKIKVWASKETGPLKKELSEIRDRYMVPYLKRMTLSGR